MIPKNPDRVEVLRLLNKLHAKGVPNWTTQDQLSVYEELQSLTFNWFRVEVPDIPKGIPNGST